MLLSRVVDKKKNYSVIVALIIAVIGGGVAAKNILEGKSAVSYASREQQLIVLINNYRVAHHLNRVTLSTGLSRSAREHSEDMLRNGYFDHRGFPQRVRKYRHASYVGENISWGTGDFGKPKGTLSLWQSSPPHKKILLTARFTRVGVGMVSGTFFGQGNAVITTANFSN